jgi:hypothetical protein
MTLPLQLGASIRVYSQVRRCSGEAACSGLLSKERSGLESPHIFAIRRESLNYEPKPVDVSDDSYFTQEISMPLSILSGDTSAQRSASIPDEQTLFASYNLTVTSHRLQYASGGFRSVMLDQVATCSVSHEERSWLAVVAGLFALAGIATLFTASQPSRAIGFFLIAALCMGIYFVTRQSTLRISTAGTHIVVPVTGKHVDEMIEVIRIIESARWRMMVTQFTARSGDKTAA